MRCCRRRIALGSCISRAGPLTGNKRWPRRRRRRLLCGCGTRGATCTGCKPWRLERCVVVTERLAAGTDIIPSAQSHRAYCSLWHTECRSYPYYFYASYFRLFHKNSLYTQLYEYNTVERVREYTVNLIVYSNVWFPVWRAFNNCWNKKKQQHCRRLEFGLSVFLRYVYTTHLTVIYFKFAENRIKLSVHVCLLNAFVMWVRQLQNKSTAFPGHVFIRNALMHVVLLC